MTAHCRSASDKPGRRPTDTLIAQHNERITKLEKTVNTQVNKHYELERHISAQYDALCKQISEIQPRQSKMDMAKGIAYSVAMIVMAFIAGAEKMADFIKGF